MCTNKTSCPLGDVIRNVNRDFYSADHNVTEEEVLAVMISVHFEWNGRSVLKTAALALEDANYHDECEQVMQMLKRLKHS